MPDYRIALSESQRAFFELVAPPLLNLVGGGTIIPVEGMKGELEQRLDRDAGIDAILFAPRGVYGIASRVQFGENYQSFTIRKERESGCRTEWEKLLAAITTNALMPTLTVQAYVDRAANKLLAASVICTRDLVYWLKQNDCAIKSTGKNEVGQSQFLVAPWKELSVNPQVRFRQLV